MHFFNIQQSKLQPSLLKIADPCLKLLITNETSKKCALVAASVLSGGIIGGLTAAIFAWNITLCASLGALISLVAAITLRMLAEHVLKNGENIIKSGLQEKLAAGIKSLIPHAEAGDIQSQLKLGDLLRKENPQLAIKYLTMTLNSEKATVQNKGEAHYYLALANKDDQKIEHMIRSVHYGYSRAKTSICRQYEEGFKVTKSTDLNIQYLTIVAENTIKAQYELGILYANQQAPNDPLAIQYLAKAAMQDHQDALHHLHEMHKKGIESENQFYKLITKEEKLPKEQYELGILYANESNHKLAFQNMEAAAKQDHVEAQIFLGGMYERGLVVEEQNSRKKAGEWYTKAAKSRNPLAVFELARFYSTDPKVYDIALKIYGLAIQLGSIQALVGLGEMHEKGLGTLQNNDKALQLYKQAMEKDDPKGKEAYLRLFKHTID